MVIFLFFCTVVLKRLCKTAAQQLITKVVHLVLALYVLHVIQYEM